MTDSAPASAAPPARIAVAIALAAVVASIGNILILLVMGLVEGSTMDPAFVTGLTVAGVLVGVVGWVLVRALTPNPAAVLRVLVPAVVVVSFVPDLLLFTYGASAVLVVGLMIMHVVVAVPVVVALRRVLPV